MSFHLKHGIEINSIEKFEYKNLTTFQLYILKKLIPDSTQWDTYLSSNIFDLYSPFLLPDMEKSIIHIMKCIHEKNHILLFGDRDTDGISSTALLTLFFREFHERQGGKLTIKNSSEGDDYGLCESAVNYVKQVKPDLLITLDFGSSNYSEIEELSELGIKVIVLDHHEIPVKISSNCFLISPKRADSKYPDTKICTSVLAMKFIMAFHILNVLEKYKTIDSESDYSKVQLNELFKKYPDLLQKQKELLDIASIGTVADMMPLTGENRTIVKYGCKTLVDTAYNKTPNRSGLAKLIQSLKLNSTKINSKDIGWNIAPVLNAAGRMGKSELALELLIENDYSKINKKVNELLNLNQERKERTKRNIERVEKYFKANPEKLKGKVIFCYSPEMEPGVSGIVATKLVQEYQKPAIFITKDNNGARGSIRSYNKENIMDFLLILKDLFLHYGGHPEAGGFSILLENLPTLESKLNEAANEWLKNENFSDKKILESIICLRSSDLTEKIIKELEIFEPFGMANQNPTLSIKEAKILNFKSMGDGSHARFSILGASPKIKFVIWNRASELEKKISNKASNELFGYLEENYFNNSLTYQFVVNEFQ